MIKPITPKECGEQKINVILPEIIQAVNELLLEEYNGQYSVNILQKDIVSRYKKIAGENAISSDELYKKHQLDIEEVYRKAGWVVSYDKPAYNENYDAIFTFKSKTSKK